MLHAGDWVLTGVSGGADSVCLLFLLAEYRKRVPFELGVVHVNHGIRPDAQEDALYVEKLCRELQLPFFCENVDVHTLAKEKKLSEEEAGRRARYQAYEKCADIWTSGKKAADPDFRVKLALAHHMGDRAETMLFHLFRGSDSRGLGSIQPVREHGEKLQVIRPLLCLERCEIEEFLKQEGIAHCEDSTNREDQYVRNRIRHHILPYAEQEICEGAARHVSQAAEKISEIEEYLQLQTEQAMEKCVSGHRISVDEFQKQHALIQKRILMEMLRRLSPEHRDISSVHVDMVQDLFWGTSGRRVKLPMGIEAVREYETVLLKRKTAEDPDGEKNYEMPLNREELEKGPVRIMAGGFHFCFQVLETADFSRIPENQYTKWFDYDKIKDKLSVRSRRVGDQLAIRGNGGRVIHKKVKDYMITEKIPGELRSHLPLLADGDQILWIPGYRISENYKVEEGTRCILQVELLETEEE